MALLTIVKNILVPKKYHLVPLKIQNKESKNKKNTNYERRSIIKS
jgi:hypothetical protein